MGRATERRCGGRMPFCPPHNRTRVTRQSTKMKTQADGRTRGAQDLFHAIPTTKE